MAVRFDADGDYFRRTTDLVNGNAACTIAGWFKISVDRDSYQMFFSLVYGSHYDFIGTYADGTTILGESNNPSTLQDIGTISLTVGQWYYIAWVRSSVSSAKLYVNLVEDGEVTLDMSARAAASSFDVGTWSLGSGNWLNGCAAHLKVWSVALSLAELRTEMNRILPARRANLYGYWPVFGGTTERTLDYSGNARNWSTGGTLADEAGPPVSWGIKMLPQSVFVVAAGGTTYNATLTGALTPSATLLKQTQKVLSGGFTPSATLLKQGQKVLTGGITPSGVLLKQTQRILTGSVTPTGAISNQGQKTLSGNFTPNGTLANQAQKVLDGNVTPIGTIVKQTQKVLSGSITPSGILAGVKTALISLVGSLTPSGALTNQVQKVLDGTLTPLGQLLNQAQKVLSGNVTPSGVLTATKIALISLVGSLTPSGSLTKETQRALSGVITPIGSILKQTQKVLSGILTPVGALVTSLVSTNLESTFKGMFRGMFRRMK